MRLSIVIPFVNRIDLLEDLLVSISEAPTNKLVEVLIIIDNRCSKARTESLAGRYGAKLVFAECYTASEKRNVGLRRASAEWVLFLDDDVEIEKTLLKKYVDEISGKQDNYFNNKLMFAGPVLFSGNTQGSRMFLASRFSNAFDLSSGSRKIKEWVVSANMCVNRYYALTMGGFNDKWNIPAGGEDIDFCLRWNAGGGIIEYVNDCIVHHSDLSVTTWSNMRRAYYYGRGEAKLISMHDSRHRLYIRPELYALAASIIIAAIYKNTISILLCTVGFFISPLVSATIKFTAANKNTDECIKSVVHESYMFLFFTFGKIAESIFLRRFDVIFRGFLFHISTAPKINNEES